MPRLDNSDETVALIYGLDFRDSNGKLSTTLPPVDLCARCYSSWLDADLRIEHPNYDDGRYYCYECGTRLTADDNK